MKELGKLTPENPDDMFYHLIGEIRTLQFEGSIEVWRNSEPGRTGNSPTHSVYAHTQNGHEIKIGSGWQRTVSSGPSEGADYVSIIIDDPGYDQPLKFSLFSRGDHAVARWKRSHTGVPF